MNESSHRQLTIATRPLTRRTFLRLGGGLAAAGLLTACGRAATTPTAAPGSKGVVVQGLEREYLAYPDVQGTVQFSNCWGGTRIPLIEQWIKDFNAIYPNIKVENDVSDCPKINDKHVASIAGGSPQSCLMITSANTAFYAEQGSLLALDDWMKRDSVSADWFYPAELQARTWEGKTYGLPNVTGGAVAMLFVNKGLLKKIGVDPEKKFETWQDLETLAAPSKKNGLFVLDTMKGTTGHMAHTYGNGGRYWNDELTKITWNEPAGVEAAEYLLRFMKAQSDKYESLSVASPRNDVIQAKDWAAEKHVATINGSWWFFNMKTTAPQIEYGTFPFPKNAVNANSKGYTPNAGGWMFSIPKGTKDQNAAWEWIKFTTTSKNACTFVEAQNRPSPVTKCNEKPELKASNPAWPVVTDNLANNVRVPTSPVHPQLMQIAYEMEEAFMYEKQAPKAALDSFAQKAQAVLDEWNAKRKKG